ncbi:hypothetical protein AVEN_106029-1 [Araneus ventricosus]|uniref:Odorant receptor n=1 Tax=Araneus ventricosus TaxID=182803 RepID=A0A4Y2NLG8_ARAVE|nr:hypothetical protein AVEN_106029-1 [Araneus ventricosus]
MNFVRRFSNCFSRKRIVPVLYKCHSAEQTKNHFSERIFIARMFYFVALVFPLKDKYTQIQQLLHFCLEYGATLLLSLYIIGDFRNLYHLIGFLPMGLIFSSLFTDIFSITIRVAILCKRRSILCTLVYLQDIHSGLQTNKLCNQVSQLAIGVFLSYVLPGTLMWYTVTMCFPGYEGVLKHYVKYTFYGLSTENKWADCFLFVITDHLLETQQHILSGFLIVLCWYLLGLLREIVESFSVIAKEEDDLERFFDAYLRYAKTVSSCVSRVEQSLSLLLLFLYGFLVFSIFSVTTYLMTAELSDVPIPMVTSQLVLLFETIIGFYITSFQAIAVHNVAVKVRNSIYEMVSRSDSQNYDMKSLLLTMSANYPSGVVITAWGLFSLKNSFLQKTTSGMITYATLLSQMED